MKSDPHTDLLGDAPVAGLHVPAAKHWAVRLRQLVLLIAVPLVIIGVASFVSATIVRIAADLRLGLDPFASGTPRVRLGLREMATRQIAVDVVRQLLIVVLVLAFARWRDGAAWRRRLALIRPAEPRAPIRRAWMLCLMLLLWPIVHIAWVSASAQALNLSFGQNVRISPILTPVLIGWWLAYVVLFAPFAEELLLRGEAFARASTFMNPAGTIVATALLFCLLHVTELGIARAVTLIPLAITLGWLRWRTGRLWPCMLLHGWSNLALLAYLLRPAGV